jgi:gentisate 1,2-dioxygenase
MREEYQSDAAGDPQLPQSNPNTGGKPTTTIAAQMEYVGK